MVNENEVENNMNNENIKVIFLTCSKEVKQMNMDTCKEMRSLKNKKNHEHENANKHENEDEISSTSVNFQEKAEMIEKENQKL